MFNTQLPSHPVQQLGIGLLLILEPHTIGLECVAGSAAGAAVFMNGIFGVADRAEEEKLMRYLRRMHRFDGSEQMNCRFRQQEQ